MSTPESRRGITVAELRRANRASGCYTLDELQTQYLAGAMTLAEYEEAVAIRLRYEDRTI